MSRAQKKLLKLAHELSGAGFHVYHREEAPITFLSVLSNDNRQAYVGAMDVPFVMCIKSNTSPTTFITDKMSVRYVDKKMEGTDHILGTGLKKIFDPHIEQQLVLYPFGKLLKTKLPKGIATEEQAKTFLDELVANGEHFHPDELPSNIVDGNGERRFTDADAEKLQELFDEISELDDFDEYCYLLALVMKNNLSVQR